MNECVWHILVANDKRIQSHCLIQVRGKGIHLSIYLARHDVITVPPDWFHVSPQKDVMCVISLLCVIDIVSFCDNINDRNFLLFIASNLKYDIYFKILS